MTEDAAQSHRTCLACARPWAQFPELQNNTRKQIKAFLASNSDYNLMPLGG